LILGAATGVGAMTLISSEMVRAAPEPTMSMNVIYPNHEHPTGDEGHESRQGHPDRGCADG
jgi:hypothetical protein